jgi:hypothetical protein
MKISVFGGSKTPPESGDYQMAVELGQELAVAGHTVMTGGYKGSMEAVSRGAYEAKGEVIGVTCRQIESWRPVKPNSYITSEIKCETLTERLLYLVNQCDLAIALPGGIGTLTEIAVSWNLLVVGVNHQPPLLLVGPGWKETMQAFYQSQDAYIPQKDRAQLVFCADAAQTLAEIRKLAK